MYLQLICAVVDRMSRQSGGQRLPTVGISGEARSDGDVSAAELAGFTQHHRLETRKSLVVVRAKMSE